jgi:hypothetical protein
MTGEREAVYCKCGAQWYGRYTDSPVIPSHNKSRRGCGLIDHDTFVTTQKIKCECRECRESRKRERAARLAEKEK